MAGRGQPPRRGRVKVVDDGLGGTKEIPAPGATCTIYGGTTGKTRLEAMYRPRADPRAFDGVAPRRWRDRSRRFDFSRTISAAWIDRTRRNWVARAL